MVTSEIFVTPRLSNGINLQGQTFSGNNEVQKADTDFEIKKYHNYIKFLITFNKILKPFAINQLPC